MRKENIIQIKLILLTFFCCFPPFLSNAQYNHTWLLGYGNVIDTNTTSTKARINFISSSFSVIPESRKMPFMECQSNISDYNGNFKLACNGCWIMDSSLDTLLNGSNLNPGLFTTSYCNSTSGLPVISGNIILPYPGDSTKYALFHMTGNYDSAPYFSATELYYSVIDMTLNGGLGGVVPGLKNVIVFQDTLSWGISACRHGNGRDWWIVALKDSSTLIHKILLTPTGVNYFSNQVLAYPVPFPGNACQPTFSPDGTKFAYTSGIPSMSPFHDVRIFSFDRCTGNLDSLAYIPKNNEFGFGLAFASNSKYLYYSSTSKLYQLNTDTTNIIFSDTLIATYDGFQSPFNSTNFWFMYLAANGKIYLTSSGPVIDIHCVNYPDSANLSCDFQQHSVHLPAYHWSSVPNHPNYYLGASDGSVCDSLGLNGLVENLLHGDIFKIYPNPNTGNFSITYLLPQNESGNLEIFDLNGKLIYKMILPAWSTLQHINFPLHIQSGIYNGVLKSGNSRTNFKLAVIK